MSGEELTSIEGADHFKIGSNARNCDQVNRDLVNQYGADSSVPKGQNFIAGSSCTTKNAGAKCLACTDTVHNRFSPNEETVTSTKTWQKDTYDHTNSYDCGPMTIGICTNVNGVVQCTDNGSSGGAPLNCSIIQVWVDQSR